MARVPNAPSHENYSSFRCEEATITNVHKRKWVVSVDTTHSAKTVDDIQISSPYLHYAGGEGIHHLPEVGARCFIAWPNDNSPPFIMGYVGEAEVIGAAGEGGSDVEPGGEAESTNDVSFRSRRMDMNPGDIALTGRDGCFVILRRGGIVQIGSTAISQRVYLPILNYIKDFAENYEMNLPGGDLSWTVERQESDPGGNAPGQYIMHMNAHAQDEKASVRIRYTPIQAPGGGDRIAWDVAIAPESIDRNSGDISGENYTMSILMDGTRTEMIGANRSVRVKGDDSLTVDGALSMEATGNAKMKGQNALVQGVAKAAVWGPTTHLGGENASIPAVKGTDLITWLTGATWTLDVATGISTLSPGAIPGLATIISNKVFVE